MIIIYLEPTLNLLISAGKKYKVDELIPKGEIKQIEKDEVKLRYLKIVEQ